MQQGSVERAISHFVESHVVSLFVWFFVAIVVGLVASARGRSLPIWFAISLLLSPVLAGILLFFVVPPVRKSDE